MEFVISKAGCRFNASGNHCVNVAGLCNPCLLDGADHVKHFYPFGTEKVCVKTGAPCGSDDNTDPFLEHDVCENSGHIQVQKEVHSPGFFRELLNPGHLAPEIVCRVSVSFHAGMGADDPQRPCVGNRRSQFSGGQPEHPSLEDGVFNPEQGRNTRLLHRTSPVR
jgi:hypothetical protein